MLMNVIIIQLGSFIHKTLGIMLIASLAACGLSTDTTQTGADPSGSIVQVTPSEDNSAGVNVGNPGKAKPTTAHLIPNLEENFPEISENSTVTVTSENAEEYYPEPIKRLHEQVGILKKFLDLAKDHFQEVYQNKESKVFSVYVPDTQTNWEIGIVALKESGWYGLSFNTGLSGYSMATAYYLVHIDAEGQPTKGMSVNALPGLEKEITGKEGIGRMRFMLTAYDYTDGKNGKYRVLLADEFQKNTDPLNTNTASLVPITCSNDQCIMDYFVIDSPAPERTFSTTSFRLAWTEDEEKADYCYQTLFSKKGQTALMDFPETGINKWKGEPTDPSCSFADYTDFENGVLPFTIEEMPLRLYDTNPPGGTAMYVLEDVEDDFPFSPGDIDVLINSTGRADFFNGR